MKKFNGLFARITSFDNLLLAAKNARKGKRFQANVAQFDFQLERNLFQLQEELTNKCYQPGEYHSFIISDPKERLISAAPYRDRVVHHALCNIITPIFEKTFIFDSYANRKGKGVHAAILRYQYFAKKFSYVIKCDIKKFFSSIDHETLKQQLRWRISCPDTLWLIDVIIDNSNKQEPHHAYFPGDDLFTPFERKRGLPIGNLTSQWWGNIYLNRFDHFMKENLKIPGYIRYVDDFVAFSSDKAQLHKIRKEITKYLIGLRLLLHPDKTQIHKVQHGVPFLGFQVFPHYRFVNKERTRRYKRYLRKQLTKKHNVELTPAKLEEGLNSWLAHLRFGQNQRLENSIFRYLRDQGVNLYKHPNGSWRVLEQ